GKVSKLVKCQAIAINENEDGHDEFDPEGQDQDVPHQSNPSDPSDSNGSGNSDDRDKSGSDNSGETEPSDDNDGCESDNSGNIDNSGSDNSGNIDDIDSDNSGNNDDSDNADSDDPQPSNSEDLIENDFDRNQYVLGFIKEWAKYGVTAAKTDELLCGMKRVFPLLPKTTRTLLNTPGKSNFEQIGTGLFWYKGIQCSLDETLTPEYPQMYCSTTLFLDLHAALRTDDDFANRRDELHHSGDIEVETPLAGKSEY
ncbi:hypothetical protein FOCC_FOCC015311, partial [Frankliniella occidentalis]